MHFNFIQEIAMNNQISQDKVTSKQPYTFSDINSNHEYIWKNISKIETLKKEDILRKKQTMCQNLQIKLK